MNFPFSQRPSSRSTVASAGLLLFKMSLFLPVAALCQNRTVAQADIPFDFVAGQGREMPAGHYTLTRVSEHIYMLQQGSAAQTRTQYLVVYAAEAPRSGSLSNLTFHQYGHSYFLNRAWFAGSGTGFRVTAGKTEKHLIAQGPLAQPTGITIAMNTAPTR